MRKNLAAGPSRGLRDRGYACDCNDELGQAGPELKRTGHADGVISANHRLFALSRLPRQCR